MRYIGFCHGVLHKIFDAYSPENIQALRHSGANAIEINYRSLQDNDKLEKILSLIKEFEYISLHLPGHHTYKNDEETKDFLKKTEDLYVKLGARLVVVHPDWVEDWDVFKGYNLNWAIENMDDRKDVRFKDVADLNEVLEKNKNIGLVLDLGHCNANDKSIALADRLIGAFKDRIKEIHLSGYLVFHDPLHRTKQVDVIKYCNKLDVPIIIESTLEVSDGVEAVKKEYDYVMAVLTNALQLIS